MTPDPGKITSETVCDDFNDIRAVIHYTRAAYELGLWESERLLIKRFFPDKEAPLIEAGCGAGRVTLGLWRMGYRKLTAFDFAADLIDQAHCLANERGASAIQFHHADATDLSPLGLQPGAFGGALFTFNGLMQIPGRSRRLAALRQLHAVCAPGSYLLFTTHDRQATPGERVMWRLERLRWDRGEEDSRLVEYGDRYFEHEAGRTFMHLPDREEVLGALAETGWIHDFDQMRSTLCRESQAVIDFSDDCRFWVARRR